MIWSKECKVNQEEAEGKSSEGKALEQKDH